MMASAAVGVPLALRLICDSHLLAVATGVACKVPTAEQAGGHFRVSPKVSGVFPGSDVTYQCEDGYETSDAMTAECDTDGSYKYPTCTGMPVSEMTDTRNYECSHLPPA